MFPDEDGVLFWAPCAGEAWDRRTALLLLPEPSIFINSAANTEAPRNASLTDVSRGYRPVPALTRSNNSSRSLLRMRIPNGARFAHLYAIGAAMNINVPAHGIHLSQAIEAGLTAR